MNYETQIQYKKRRENGVFYTNKENIHKVIDPLFLWGLKEELNDIKKTCKKENLVKFWDKIGQLCFLDPACGDGNFLVETYVQLKKIENEIMGMLNTRQAQSKVSLANFCGIEIDGTAAKLAKENLKTAAKNMARGVDTPPAEPNITVGNALRLNWESIINKNKLRYIIGNPPFIGSIKLNTQQKEDRRLCFGGGGGELDYAACWFIRTAEYIAGTRIECAFISTSSVCQGQQVSQLWGRMIDKIKINFAITPFQWDTKNKDTANVFVAVIGFSETDKKNKFIINGDKIKKVKNISPYLIDAENIIVTKRKTPLNDAPTIINGIKPTDDGNLLLSNEEKKEMIKKEPASKEWIRPFVGCREHMHKKQKWCLWLSGITQEELKKNPSIKKRIQKCQEWREKQTKTGDGYRLRDIPHLMRTSYKFGHDNFLLIPVCTSSRREYIPMCYYPKKYIPGDSVSIIKKTSLYILGVLESNVHMAWMRTVCGRLGDGYRYSGDIVYNTFPWCNPTQQQKKRIEKTAQGIIDARNIYSDITLAYLYNKETMPEELKEAHKQNDIAVMDAYGFINMSEQEIVANLMDLYREQTSN